MMRSLVLEDEKPWCEILSHSLRSIPGMEVDCFDDVDLAWEALQDHEYVLVTVDISLIAFVTSNAVTNRKGFDLLKHLRSSDYPLDPALLIVSGYPTEKHIRDAFADFKVDDFITKVTFNGKAFAKRARRAILDALVRTADYRIQNRSEITISLKENRFILAELRSPSRKARYVLSPGRFKSASYAKRADRLNLQTLAGDGSWRGKARTLGRELHTALMSDENIAKAVIHGRNLSTRDNPAVIQFVGDGAVLGVPFELLTDGNDYLCFENIIARGLTSDGPPTKKGEPFHEFIAQLAERGEPLRILLVACNSDGKIPQVDVEAAAVRRHLERALDALGIKPLFDDLRGLDATHKAVTERLRSGRHHLFHYAGHGRFSDTLPEVSGLVLTDGHELRADELKQLLDAGNLRLAFLSCCVGARSARDVGRGHFHGTLEALVRADIPIAVGYRWIVSDEGAETFATTFYTELLRTLSPGLALLRSRVAATGTAEGGRDNSTWASPVIVCQTAP